jgi:hypothetical protein
MQDQRVFSIEKNGQMPFVLFLYEEFDDTTIQWPKTDRHDIAEILLKVALNTIIQIN